MITRREVLQVVAATAALVAGGGNLTRAFAQQRQLVAHERVLLAGRKQAIELAALPQPHGVVGQHHETGLHQIEADLLIIAGHAFRVEVPARHHDTRSASGKPLRHPQIAVNVQTRPALENHVFNPIALADGGLHHLRAERRARRVRPGNLP